MKKYPKDINHDTWDIMVEHTMSWVYMIGYIAIQFLTLATALYRIYGIPLMLTVVLIAIATTIYMHFGPI